MPPGQGLVAMGALHDDLLDPVGLKRGDVLAGQHEVDELVAHSPRRMWLEESAGARINEARCAQALDTDPDLVATSCPL